MVRCLSRICGCKFLCLRGDSVYYARLCISETVKPLTRYAAGIEYAGSAYCGWQRQSHCDAVQTYLESALSYVADEAVELTCAGRTDAGVLAVEQVAHFDSSAVRDQRAWVMGANCRMPRDIRIKWVTPVSDEFHARYSAAARAYRYLVLNTEVPSAVFHQTCAWEFRPLDHQAMHDCAQMLLGEHDFSSFRAAGCQAKSVHRNVQEIRVSRRGNMVLLDIKANAFLYHMVRNIAGSLIKVGSGQQDATWFEQVFQSRDRRQAAMTAPACGLYFVRAFYPESFGLASQAVAPILIDI